LILFVLHFSIHFLVKRAEEAKFTRDILGKCVERTRVTWEVEDVPDKNLYTFTIWNRSAWQRGRPAVWKNGELGYWPYLKANSRGRSAHRIAWTCAPDGSQVYSHTLSTFLHPLKKPCGGYLVRRIGRQSWNTRVI